MKRLVSFILLCATLFVMGTVMAQAPQRVSYQAVVRHANNRLAAGETMDVRISILQGSAEGQAVYVESRQVTTNANGLFTITVGTGDNLGGQEFADINWAEGPYFLKSEVDAEGDQTYSAVSVSQVLSVPYALHATTASNLIGMTDSLNAIRTKVASDMQIGRIHTENAVNALSDEILALRTVIDDTVLFLTEYLDDEFAAISARFDEVEDAMDSLNADLREYIDDEIETVNETIEDLSETVNSRIDDVEENIDSLSNNWNEGFSNVESTFDALNADLDNRFDSVFATIDQTASDLTNTEIEIYAAINTLDEKVDSLNEVANTTFDSVFATIDQTASDLTNTEIELSTAINALDGKVDSLNAVANTTFDSVFATIDQTASDLTNTEVEIYTAINTLDGKVDSIDGVTNAALQALRDAIDTNYAHDSINFALIQADIINTRNVHDGDMVDIRNLIDSIDNAKQDTIDAVALKLAAEAAALEGAVNIFNDTIAYLQDSIDAVALNLAAEAAAREAAVAIFNDTVAYLQDSIDNVAANLATEVATREAAVAIFNDTVAYLQDTIDNVAANLATEVATREAAVAIFNDTVAYLQDSIDNVAANLATEVATREAAVALINDTVTYLQDTIDKVAAIVNDTVAYLQDTIDKVAARIDAIGTPSDAEFVRGQIHDTANVVRAELTALSDINSTEIENLKQRTDNLEAARTLDGVLTIGNDAGAKQIKNAADPTDAQDVATKAYVDILAHLIDSLRNEIARLTSSLNRMNTYSDTTVYSTADIVSAGIVIRGHTYTTFGTFNDTIGLNAAGFDTLVRIHLVNAAEAFGDGSADGTMEHPYVLSTQADLFAFYDMTAPATNAFADKYFTLANDINVDKAWNPIVKFTGVFDGANHTITFAAGINADAKGNVGFISLAQNDTIRNLSVAGNITFDASSTSRFGAIAAQAKNIVIDNCHGLANLTHNNTTGSSHIGGLVGAASANYIVMSNSSANAAKLNVTVSQIANLGGLIGYSTVTDSIKITNCAGTDTLIATANKAYVGGLIGHQGDGSVKVIIDNCYVGGVLNVPTFTAEALYGMLIGKNASAVTTNIQYNYINLYAIRNGGVSQNPYYMNSEPVELELANNRIVYYKASGTPKWIMFSAYVKDITTTVLNITVGATETSNVHTALFNRAQSEYGVAEAGQWEANTAVEYGSFILNKR